MEDAATAEERLQRRRFAGVSVVNPFDDSDMDRLLNPQKAQTGATQHLRPVFVSVHSSLSRSAFAEGSKWNDLLATLQRLYPIVSIHSGGGAWPVEETIPFHELSLFVQWALDTPCKLFITEAIARSARG